MARSSRVGRQDVYEYLISRLEELEDYNSITVDDLQRAVELYIDEIAPKGDRIAKRVLQLEDRVYERRDRKFPISPIQVIVSGKTVESIIFDPASLYQFLDDKTGSSRDSIAVALMIATEHLCVTLLFIESGYLNRSLMDFTTGEPAVHKRAEPMYTYNGALYSCSLKKFFAYSTPIQGLVYVTTRVEDPPGVGPTSRLPLFANRANSCYIDSLLLVIFLSAAQGYRTATLGFDVMEHDYQHWDSAKGKPVNPNVNQTKAAENWSGREFKDFVYDIQEVLLGMFERISTAVQSKKMKYTTCTSLRRVLSRGVSGILSEQLSSGELFSILAKFFPRLIEGTHKALHVGQDSRGNLTEPTPRVYTNELFTFSDYMIDRQETEPGKTRDWRTIDSDTLTFQNGLTPMFTHYGSMKSERVTHNLFGIEVSDIVRKNRAFSEYILQGRYRLAGVVLNHGRLDGPTISSGHYTAFIRPYYNSDVWYRYDDLAPSMKAVDEGKLPSYVFWDTGTRRPELLMYERVA